MKLSELFEDTQSEKELLKLRAARGREDVEKIKDITRKVSNGNKGAKNVERGFRNALKRQYKKIAAQEAE
jgi:hypothetical protein